MVETVRKKISVERSVSRTPGVLPYVSRTEDGGLKIVASDDINGNWGEFVADIAKAHKETYQADWVDREVEKIVVTDRVKYLDIISRYNEANRIISEGVKAKCVKNEAEVIHEDDDFSGRRVTEPSICEPSVTIEDTESALCLTTKILDDDYPISRSGFTPVNIENYSKNGFIYSRTTIDEEIESGKYYNLVNDYETLEKIVSWWEGDDENEGHNWCAGVFGNVTLTSGIHGFMKFVETYIIGKVETPLNIEGIHVPEFVYYTNISLYTDWFAKFEGNKNGERKNEWEDHGGDDFKDFIDGIEPKFVTEIPEIGENDTLTYVVPQMSIPVLIDQECNYVGVYESYMPAKQNYSVSGTYSSTWVTDLSGMVESRLECVIDDDAVEVAGIVGLWADFPEEGSKTNLFKCRYYTGTSVATGETAVTETYTGETWARRRLVSRETNVIREEDPQKFRDNVDRVIVDFEQHTTSTTAEPQALGDNTSSVTTTYKLWYDFYWWECTRQTCDEAARIQCGDEEPESSSKYRTVSMLECFKNLAAAVTGHDYYFMVKKDNGAYGGQQGQPVYNGGNAGYVTFKIPYVAGSLHNAYQLDDDTYVGDYINSISIVGSSWTITYTLGAKIKNGAYVAKTGIQYQETYPYFCSNCKTIRIDGQDGIKFYYDSIDTESTKVTVYSEEYGLYRKANRAKIVGMEVGTTFNDEEMFDAPVFTREDSGLFMTDPKKVFNVTINRGSAAAFESHFKLSECNSIEDLENYGNNYYNL